MSEDNGTGMRRKAGLAALALFAAGAAAVVGGALPAASASASDRVDTLPGNPDCQDLGLANEFKIESGGEFPGEGTYESGDPGTESKGDTAGFSVEITYTDDDPLTFDFEASTAVDVVLVKAGPGATAYTFDPASTTGEGLVSPVDDSISHITFCWDEGGPTTTTTTTVPGSSTTTAPESTTTTAPESTTTTAPGVTTTAPGTDTTTPGGGAPVPAPPAAAPIVDSPDYAG